MSIKIDDFLRHQVYLERLDSNIINTAVYPSLEASYRAIRAQLMAAENINTPVKLRRIVRLVNDEIDRNSGWGAVTESLDEAAIYESDFQARLITSSTGAAMKSPAKKQVREFMEQSLMTVTGGQRVQSALWTEFTQNNITSQKQLVDGLIRQGYLQGDTVNTIARRIKGAYDGVIKRDAETLARTGFSHYMTGARQAMAEAQTVPMDVVYMATFDNRTTLQCRGLDGRRWPLDDDAIQYPPVHYGCRSTLLYLPRGEDVTGTRSAIGGQSGSEAKEAFDNREQRLRTASQVRYRGRRDDNIFKPGQVRAQTSSDAWLRQQPAWFVDDSLGQARGRLFREGMPIERFTDMTGRTLTLDELRARDSDLFARAGL